MSNLEERIKRYTLDEVKRLRSRTVPNPPIGPDPPEEFWKKARVHVPVGHASFTPRQPSAKEIAAEIVADPAFRKALRAIVREIVAECLAARKPRRRK